MFTDARLQVRVILVTFFVEMSVLVTVSVRVSSVRQLQGFHVAPIAATATPACRDVMQRDSVPSFLSRAVEVHHATSYVVGMGITSCPQVPVKASLISSSRLVCEDGKSASLNLDERGVLSRALESAAPNSTARAPNSVWAGSLGPSR